MTMMAGSPPATVPTRFWWGLAFVLTANVLVFGGVTIMNVALPAVQADLGFGDQARQWVVTLYSLCFGSLILLGGRIADVVGLRRCMITGVVGFAAASGLGGLASTTTALLVARALQGAAGALVAATALALLSIMFPQGWARARAFAVLGIVMGIATAGSFLLAGAFVAAWSWRWCLLVNVPAGVVAVIGILRTVPADQSAARTRIDVGGALLMTAALACLVVGFERAGVLGWARWPVIILLIGGLVFLAAFVVSSSRSAQPLIPPRLVREWSRTSAFAAVFVVGLGMFAGMFVLTSFLLDVQGYSALRVGLAFLPFGVSATVTSQWIAVWRARLDPAILLGIGLALVAGALATFLPLDVGSRYLTGVLPAMLLLGAGATVVMVVGANAATQGAGADSGVAGSMINSLQQIGAALGTALFAAIMAATAAEGSTAGLAHAGAVGAVLVGLTAVVLIVGGALRTPVSPPDESLARMTRPRGCR